MEETLVLCAQVTKQIPINSARTLTYVYLQTGGIPDDHFIEISTSPSEGPFAIGSEVTLHCRVSPYLHNGIIYQWKTSVPGVSITQEDYSTPNITITIPAGHTKYGYYYCVAQSNGSTLANGFTVLEIQGMQHFLI